MSAFDDEFGLFGEEGEEDERRSTLGARKIASSETIIDDIEPEDDVPRRRGPASERPAPGGGYRNKRQQGGGRKFGEKRHREPVDPAAAQERAGDLLGFLAKKLVAKPDAVLIESYPADGPEPPVLELIVDPDDLGKVIGRSGRVAQALRTIVRATAEGKIAVDIYDTEEANEDVEGPNDDAEE
ncbi:MAG: KH domain-containing protein [Vulcanimicrobiaceae bacterium]